MANNKIWLIKYKNSPLYWGSLVYSYREVDDGVGAILAFFRKKDAMKYIGANSDIYEACGISLNGKSQTQKARGK